MTIKEEFPPNINEIRAALGDIDKHKPIFTYGDTIFNPFKRTITLDVEEHEKVHSRQQGDYPDVWWFQYLRDEKFRLKQEIEAYGVQYSFAKKHLNGKILEWLKEKLAQSLSGGLYGNLISYGEAVSKIRNYDKYER